MDGLLGAGEREDSLGNPLSTYVRAEHPHIVYLRPSRFNNSMIYVSVVAFFIVLTIAVGSRGGGYFCNVDVCVAHLESCSAALIVALRVKIVNLQAPVYGLYTA